MKSNTWTRAVSAAGSAVPALLDACFAVLSPVSGSNSPGEQPSDCWHFVVALAVGFGVQSGTYSTLRQVTRHGGRGPAIDCRQPPSQ